MVNADDPLRTLSLVVTGFPVNVGSAERTTLPVPVDDVTPVPPLATGSVPVTAVVRLILEIVLVAPEIVAPVSVLLVRVSVVARPTKVSVDVGRVSVPPLTIVAIIGAVSVLLISVCASDVPTTAPAGAAFRVVTAPVPAPTKKLPDVNVATPVPPLATDKIPVVIADASRVTADHDEFPAPSVFRKVFAAPTVGGNTRL